MELDSPPLPLSCVTLSICHQPFEPVSSSVNGANPNRALQGSWDCSELEPSTVPDAQPSGGAGLELYPRLAQTFTQLIAVTAEFCCESGLWSQEALRSCSEGWIIYEGTRTKCWPASLGVSTGPELREWRNACGSVWLEMGFLKETWIEWDEIKLGKGRRKNLVFSESHDAPLWVMSLPWEFSGSARQRGPPS